MAKSRFISDLHRVRAVRQTRSQKTRQALLVRRDEVGHAEPERAIAIVSDQLSAMLKYRLDEAQGPPQLAHRCDGVCVREVLDSAARSLRLAEPMGADVR